MERIIVEAFVDWMVLAFAVFESLEVIPRTTQIVVAIGIISIIFIAETLPGPTVSTSVTTVFPACRVPKFNFNETNKTNARGITKTKA